MPEKGLTNENPPKFSIITDFLNKLHCIERLGIKKQFAATATFC